MVNTMIGKNNVRSNRTNKRPPFPLKDRVELLNDVLVTTYLMAFVRYHGRYMQSVIKERRPLPIFNQKNRPVFPPYAKGLSSIYRLPMNLLIIGVISISIDSIAKRSNP
jgi:hypothetical protein